ncbi:anti-sigma factor [Gammaproteobacteria bacterium AS21]|jgi:anti-sigma-K factor RskA
MHEYDLSDIEQRDQAAAEYVLGILTAQDKARVEALMAVSHDMQKEIESWREHLDVFNRNLTPIKPPANIWKNINKETKPEKNIWSWRSLAGFSLALMLSVGLFLQWPQQGKIYSVPLIANENQQPGWVMNTSMSKQQLVVESKYPVDMPENTYYELWLMEKGHEPMSLGFLPASGKRVIPFEKSWADRILDCEILVTMEGPKGAPDGYNMGPVSDQAKWKQVSF